MSPGLVGSEVAESSPILYRPMEETIFPRIPRKSALSVGSDGDFRNDNLSYTASSRRSYPSSVSSSPTKFPSIDRSKSTSVASLTSSNPSAASRVHRSRTRDRGSRGGFCRSPSLPSNLDYGTEFGSVDFSLMKRGSPGSTDRSLPGSPADTIEKDENMKLPNIFAKENNFLHKTVSHRDIPSWKSDRHRSDNSLGLRRTDSFRHTFHSSPDAGSLSSRETCQRNNSNSQALLLPLRSDTNVKLHHKKKKKKSSRHNSQGVYQEGVENPATRVQYHRYNSGEGEEALDAIARENGLEEDTTVAIEIQSPRTVKRWMKGSNNRAQKEGEVKA